MKIGTVVARDGINAIKMHCAPDLSKQVLLSIPIGEQIIVSAETDDWCQVWYHGKTGYVLKKFLQINDTPDIVFTEEQKKAILDNIDNILAILEEVL